MKLKSIAITGFKSFADRILVNYHNGITGVIGPNGSGKSNIIDAVRWVMGEQTAKSLRADDPTDIIFSGSQNRKPLGMAEVTLTFANNGTRCPPEFLHLPEISIGRRIYRDGEREYFLNREPCRLRDIVDFLLSIGLGSKSYAIIQQDKRDRIIQASPEDLREILEETAGITIFKMRRKEAEKRLESTADRLKSLGEIENELVRQNDVLKEQVEKAVKKISYLNELKNKEIELCKNHIGFYRNLSEKLKKEIDERQKEILTSSSLASEWEAEANEHKALQLELVQQIKRAESDLEDQKINLTKFQERMDNFKNRHQDHFEQKARLEKEILSEKENLEREAKRQQQHIHDLEANAKELEQIDAKIESIMNRFEEMEESLHVDRIRGDEIKAEIRAIESAEQHLFTKNENVLETISRLNQQLQKHQDNLSQFHSQKTNLENEKADLGKELNSISAGLDQLTNERATAEAELTHLNQQMEEERAKRDNTKENLIKFSTIVQALEKTLESSQGSSEGASALKSHCQEKIISFLYDCVQLHRDEELILEKSNPYLFQAAIVENIEVLIDVIDKMEEQNISQANFFIKDFAQKLSSQEISAKEKLMQIPGIRCVGDRLLSYKLIEAKNLFDRIFIVQDEWLFLKTHKTSIEIPTNFMFISERGCLLSPFGEFHYGEFSDSENLGLKIMSQKRELAEAKVLKENQQEQLAIFEGVLYSLSEKKKHFEAKLSQFDSTLSQEKVGVLKLTSQVENIEIQLKHLRENFYKHEEEQKFVLEDLENAKNLFATNQQQIEKLENDKKSQAELLEEFQMDYAAKKEEHEEVGQQLQTNRSQRAVILERKNNNQRNYEEICYHIQRLQTKLDGYAAQLDNLNLQSSSSEHQIQELQNEISQVKNTIHVLQGNYEFLLQEEAEKSEQLRVLEQKIKAEKESENTRMKFINDKKLELARYDTILETAIKDAFERFALNSSDFQSPQTEDTSPQYRLTLEARIKELNHLIGELGPVNERAVQEYQEVVERLEFLIKQKLDIESSVLELTESIKTIEETTKERFKDIFEKVNEHFKSLFPVLFPNGYGELSLINPENLLTTGVEILVRLPGKKMQNMSLFSGGEKALTAISLIFSLLKTTPAPFCFLDEVDAPLDEANVGRFNNVLEALSDEFQFVVITHNRRTMEILDTIYGISMNEPGVSKLVSVDLTDVPPHLRKKAKAQPTDRVGATASP